jgi:hypothetical protein
MKTKSIWFVLLLFFILIVSRLGALCIADPNDRLYDDLSFWYERGYIKDLPMVRPYSLQVIKHLLSQAIENGMKHDVDRAQSYYDELFGGETEISPGKSIPAALHPVFSFETWLDGSDYYGEAAAACLTNGIIGSLFSYSAHIAYAIVYEPETPVFPSYTRVQEEWETGGGVIELDDIDLLSSQLGLGGFFIGTESLSFQAGVMRTSFGPFFHNGAIIGPQCPAAGHISFSYRTGWFSLSSVFLDLVPKYREDPVTGGRVSIGRPEFKYLLIHSLEVSPFNWMSLGLLQSVIGGKRFNAAYLIPLQNLFFSQQLSGNYDSSFIGLYGRFRLPFSLTSTFVFYVDDWDAFSSSSKQGTPFFNLDFAQNKFALQTGFAWSPDYPFMKRISIDYLMITPYTFTHSARSAVPFLSYTHLGCNVGSILEPNSDQTILSLDLTPLPCLDCCITGRFIRHGNASEGLDQGTGTIFDDGYLSDGTVSFYGPSRFLTQDVIEYVLQAGTEATLTIPFSWGTLFSRAGYTFEYAWNKDLVENNNRMNHSIMCEVGVEF